MTPLSASLIFVIISVAVTIFRNLFFPTQTINGNDDSNISFQKLHTITITRKQIQRQPYNSLYQAYFKPQTPKQFQTPLPYSSYAFKKAILNHEGVYLCQQKFAAIFQERTFCENNDKSCKWKTLITVYRLPFLKKEESQTVEVDGRVLSNKKFQDGLFCKARSAKQGSFQLNFVVILNSKDSKKGAGWTMHSLIVEEERQGWRREGTLQLKLLKWKLKNINHYPELYSFDQNCLTYVTKEEPWLIHYNCANRWQNFNILNPEVQKEVFSPNKTRQNPPFQPSHHVTPIFLKYFNSAQKIYFRPSACIGPCPRQQIIQQRHFLTYVFQIINSPLKFGKTYIQITLAINGTKKANFVSYNILSSNLNPQKQTQFDCSLTSKQNKLLKGVYAYQVGPNEENIVASFYRHSLLCVCYQHLGEDLHISEVTDLIGNFNSSDIPHELIVRSKDAFELRKLQNMFYRRQALFKKKQEPKEESSWFDFDVFNFQYFMDQESQSEIEATVDTDPDAEQKDDQTEDGDKKQKKINKGKKKDEKKRVKKGRKDRKQQIKFPDDSIGEKIQEMHDNFIQIQQNDPFEAQNKNLCFPMPQPQTQGKIKIINGDPQYPLIYMQGTKKHLFTYQLKQDQQGKHDNKTQRDSYTYRYAQIYSESKVTEIHVHLQQNDTNKVKYREEEIELDRFLLSVLQKNNNIINNVKSITVVQARYDEGGKQFGLRGFLKPFCRQVIIAWGWGIEVYQVNWDRKGHKSQIVQIEDNLNTKIQGIQMATLLPFIQLFATVYCLFQALITSR